MSTPKKMDILLASDIDPTLSINDIKNDIKKCERMIKRSSHKISLYNRKLDSLRNGTDTSPSLIEKGLQLFNIVIKKEMF